MRSTIKTAMLFLLLTVFAAGCGSGKKDYDQNAVVINKDLSVWEICLEDTGDNADIADITAFIQEKVSEANEGLPEDDPLVTFTEPETEEGVVAVELEYRSAAAYADFNNVQLDILQMGQGTDIAEYLVDAEPKGVKEGFDLTETLNNEDCYVVVFQPASEYIINVPGDIEALGGNAELLSDDEALINGYSVIIYEY